MFRADQPIQSENEDLLGRGSFAKALANAICAYQEKDSIVVGLYGAWGSGKTSIINMTIEQIDTLKIKKPKQERNVVVRFNPWNYSDQNQLISQFFKQLSFALKKSDFAGDAEKIGQQLEAYASFFEPLALIASSGVGIWAVIVFKVFQLVGKAGKSWGSMKAKDLAQVKFDLHGILSKVSAKIIIVIDDIDRLNNIEIRQIFQLIKSLGDFPNTVYLLAFDKQVVINALTKVQEGPGSEYLEKIVQIPFEVPLADKKEIEKLLFNQLDQLIKDIPEDQWDQVYWGNIYHSGLKHFFNNIRDVTRYINSVRLSFGMIKGEVNAIDFLAITGIQVFLPDLYSGIRDNKNLFSGASRDRAGQSQKDEDIKTCDDILNKSGIVNVEQIKDFLKRLFPRLESIYGNMNYGSDWLDNWRRSGRVCSPDMFDIFFRLSLPKSELSQKEILRILATANNYSSFFDELVSLEDQGKIIRFLDRLEDYTKKDILEENISNIIKTLMDLGDLFPEGDTGFFGFDTPLRILRITHQLLRRMDDTKKRYTILKDAFENAEKSVYTIVHEVSVQDQEHGRYNLNDKPRTDEDRTLPAEYLDELEKLACEKIQIWANNGLLAKHKKLAGILYSWERWNGIEDVRGFVTKLIETDEGLLDFVAAFLSKSTSHGMSDYVGRLHWSIPIDSIKHFVDPETFKERVRVIEKGAEFRKLPEDKQKAVKIFLDTIDGKIKSRWDD